MYYKKILISSFTRFIVIGGTSTCIDFSLYILLSQRINISGAKALSMIGSCTFSFFMNKGWTFHDKEVVRLDKMLKYVISQTTNIIINVCMNTFIFRIFGMKILAFIIATVTAMIINYYLQRNFVFKERFR